MKISSRTPLHGQRARSHVARGGGASQRRRPRAASRFALVAVLFALLVGSGACSGQATTSDEEEVLPGLTHVVLRGPIDVGALALLTRAVRTAEARGDEALLLEIDTPGGAVDVLQSMWGVLDEAEADGVRVHGFVHGDATSAGAGLALACERLYMSPKATLGSAMPVTIGPQGLMELPEEGGVREKGMSFLRSKFAAVAEHRGRPAALARAMVDADLGVVQVRRDTETVYIDGDAYRGLRESGADFELLDTIVPEGRLLNVGAQRAVELGLADGVADDAASVLEKLGYAHQVERLPLERSRGEDTIAWIERLTPLLLLAGLVLGFVELKTPGFGVAGILSIACFAILLTGQYLAGLADIPHIAAVAVGVGLIVVEIFLLPGTLWVGFVGGVLVLGGLILGSLGPGFSFDDALSRQSLLESSWRVVGATCVALLIAFALSRFLPKTPLLRRAVLMPSTDVARFGGAMPESSELPALGARLVATSALRPVGKVAFEGALDESFEARSLGPVLAAGELVRVIEIDAGRLVVEPLASGADPARRDVSAATPGTPAAPHAPRDGEHA